MIAKHMIELGKKYEVKPKEYHRSLVGVAEEITDQGIVFAVEYCDLCDRETAAANNQKVLATDWDVKQAIGERCFFS